MPTELKNDPVKDFEYVMDLVTNFEKSKNDYNEGLNKLESIVNQMSEKAKELKLDVGGLKRNAEMLEIQYGETYSPFLTIFQNSRIHQIQDTRIQNLSISQRCFVGLQ